MGPRERVELIRYLSKHHVWWTTQFEGAIRVTPLFSALTACWTEINTIAFFAAEITRFNVPITVTLRADADSLNSLTSKFVVMFSK